MNVEQMGQRFHELEKQREAGEIDDEQFAAEVEKLQFQDEEGRLWMIDPTGQWRYKKGNYWVQGAPPRKFMPIEPQKELPPPAKPPSSPFPKVILFLAGVIFIVIVLFIACILVGPGLIPRPGTPTVVSLVTETATPSPAVTPTQIPTDTPSLTTPPAQVSTDISSPTPTATTTCTPTSTDTPSPTPTATVTSTPTPINTPKPIVTGKIAFPVFDPKRGTYDIFIANADGTDRKKIREEASQPCLSPDGTEITYRSWRSDKRGLIVAHTFGDDIWTITTRHEASRPSVSREGTVYHCRQSLDTPGQIYLSRGSGEPQVIKCGDQLQVISGESPAWVSGERLVYKGCVGTACGLYLTDSMHDGAGLTQLTHETSDTNPEASPDGRKIALMSHRDGNWEIYVMDLNTREVKRLTENAANDGLPIWSPDGWTIAFASDRGGEWAMWAMNPDGSNQRRLFSLGGSLHGEVRDAPLHERGGWEEERLSWVP